VVVIMPHSRRSFVERLDFVTSVGHGDGPGARTRLGLHGQGPTSVISDLGVLEPDAKTKDLVLVAVHEGVEIGEIVDATAWDLRVAKAVATTEAPTEEEKAALLELTSR
jgi:glutaconate CoA-transferase subunit B